MQALTTSLAHAYNGRFSQAAPLSAFQRCSEFSLQTERYQARKLPVSGWKPETCRKQTQWQRLALRVCGSVWKDRKTLLHNFRDVVLTSQHLDSWWWRKECHSVFFHDQAWHSDNETRCTDECGGTEDPYILSSIAYMPSVFACEKIDPAEGLVCPSFSWEDDNWVAALYGKQNCTRPIWFIEFLVVSFKWQKGCKVESLISYLIECR